MLANYRNSMRMALLVGLFAAPGCGFGPPPIGLVRGKVLFNGQPLANVRVEFYPEKETGDRYLVSRATTREDGSFQLTCDDDRAGAVLGWHKIVVKPIRQEGGGNPRDAEAPSPTRTAKPKINLTPYQTLDTTRERREVVAGDNNFDLNLAF